MKPITRRTFDIVFSLLALIILSPVLLSGFILATADTRFNGIFKQRRVGRLGKHFTIFKFRTMHPYTREISKTGSYLRNWKIDELPQLFNILIGDMTFVGPRPDTSGYYDRLTGENCKILKLKPGITGPASLKYFSEETILSLQENPLKYNDTVIFPDKVTINLQYYHTKSFKGDIIILFQTAIMIFKSNEIKKSSINSHKY